MKRMWGVLGAGLILGCLSCSWFSGPSKPKIIVEFEEMPGDTAPALSPRWSPDGSLIYFICWDIWEDPCICSTDPEGEVVELLFREHEMAPEPLDVSPTGDRVAYWTNWWYGSNGCDRIIITDLEGNITDSIKTTTWGTSGRFSKVTDTLFYIFVPYNGLRQVNLNTGDYKAIVDNPKTGEISQFDLYPDDTAVVIGDTVYSLTSDDKRPLPSLPAHDFPTYLCYSVNQAEPRYIAISGLGDVGLPPDDTLPEHASKDNTYTDKIIIADMLEGATTTLEAAPRDRRDKKYQGVWFAEFSPDGNSLVYSVFVYNLSFEIGLITDVLD